MTRRTAIGLLAGASASSAPAATPQREQRRYRADAVITFLSMKIYSRAGVGSGYAFNEEIRDAASSVNRIGFAGGSWPERARGLNRLGFIQEHIVERNARMQEANYFGFMTASPEEGLAEARKALDERPGEVPISAISGAMTVNRYQSTVARVSMAPGLTWGTWRSHLPQIRKAIDGHPSRHTRSQETTAQPFLYTLSLAIRSKEPRAEYRFAYGEYIHTLVTEKTRDEKMGERMKAIRIVQDHRTVWRMAAVIRNPVKSSQTKFQLWFDAASSPLPIRIELQPRSFLRLVFEADPSVPASDFPEVPAAPSNVGPVRPHSP